MATYSRPDVYIEEVLNPNNAPLGVSTSVAAFCGATKRGPSNKAILITSFDAFIRIFGGALEEEPLFYSVRSFFQNGGSACYIVRLTSSTSSAVAANTSINNEASTAFLKFSAGYRSYPSVGIAGKQLSVKITQSSLFTSNTTTGDILVNGAQGDTRIQVSSSAGLRVGDFIKITDHSSADTYHEVASTETEFDNGVIKHFINLTSGLAGLLSAGANSRITLLAYDIFILDGATEVELFSNVSVNPNSDLYFETIINDEQTGSRFVIVEDLIATTTPANDREVEGAALNLGIGLATDGQDELTGFSLNTDLFGDVTNKTGLQALVSKDSVNLLCVPPSLDTVNGIFPSTSLQNVHAAMLQFCGDRMDMFAILDAPAGKSSSDSAVGSIGEYRSGTLGSDSYWGALYYPQLKVQKKSSGKTLLTIPPSGAIAGLYSRVDAIGAPNGGVSSSPAGYGEFGTIRGIAELEVEISEAQHGNLNVMGVNCIRVVDRANGQLPAALVLGARTLSSSDDFRYINVRRMMTYIEKETKALGKPFLFKNNGPRLWAEMTDTITSFLSSLYASGQLAGNSESEAFFVKINSTTNTAENIQQGILVGEIGVALLRPAEFVVFRFSQIQTGGQE